MGLFDFLGITSEEPKEIVPDIMNIMSKKVPNAKVQAPPPKVDPVSKKIANKAGATPKVKPQVTQPTQTIEQPKIEKAQMVSPAVASRLSGLRAMVQDANSISDEFIKGEGEGLKRTEKELSQRVLSPADAILADRVARHMIKYPVGPLVETSEEENDIRQRLYEKVQQAKRSPAADIDMSIPIALLDQATGLGLAKTYKPSAQTLRERIEDYQAAAQNYRKTVGMGGGIYMDALKEAITQPMVIAEQSYEKKIPPPNRGQQEISPTALARMRIDLAGKSEEFFSVLPQIESTIKNVGKIPENITLLDTKEIQAEMGKTGDVLGFLANRSLSPDLKEVFQTFKSANDLARTKKYGTALTEAELRQHFATLGITPGASRRQILTGIKNAISESVRKYHTRYKGYPKSVRDSYSAEIQGQGKESIDALLDRLIKSIDAIGSGYTKKELQPYSGSIILREDF